MVALLLVCNMVVEMSGLTLEAGQKSKPRLFAVAVSARHRNTRDTPLNLSGSLSPLSPPRIDLHLYSMWRKRGTVNKVYRILESHDQASQDVLFLLYKTWRVCCILPIYLYRPRVQQPNTPCIRRL
jgi:hypothetical protein